MQDEDRLRALESRITVIERDYAVGTIISVNADKRLSSIEDTLRWLVRLIIGALLMAAVAFSMKGGFYA